MFGPVISRIMPSSGIGRRVVGDERALRFEDVEHGVAAVDDLQDRFVDQLRAAVAALREPVRPGRTGRRAAPATAAVACRRRAAACTASRSSQEQLVLQVLGLLVGRQHLLFVLLQFRRDVAFGVLERLLADVVGGHVVAVGVGDLDVVAEDLVEADLQVGDAGPFDLLRLVAGDPLLAAGRQLAELVQLRRDSRGG